MKNKPTLTIGIPAYNEVNNLRKLLPLIAQLSHQKYILKEIIINSDGSTDDTNTLSQYISPLNLKIILNRKRVGKPIRVNQIMQRTTTDILVIMDADIIPQLDAIDHLVTPLNPNIAMMTSGHSQPLASSNLITKVALAGISIWDTVRLSLPPHSYYDSEGMLRAFTRPLYQTMKFPPVGNIEDTYSYLFCRQHHYSFIHIPQAIVKYHLPTSFHDYLSQQRRYHAGHIERAYFPIDLLSEVQIVTNRLRFRALLKNWANNPFYITLYLLFSLYLRINLAINKYSYQGTWEILSSTRLHT